MDFENYVPTIEYPTQPHKPFLPSNVAQVASALRAHADKLDVYEKELAEFETKKKIYDEHVADNYARFKVDALKEVGLWKHEAGNRAFEYAYNKGGSYNDCFYILVDLAEVILGPR
jgi:hypothetical protein